MGKITIKQEEHFGHLRDEVKIDKLNDDPIELIGEESKVNNISSNTPESKSGPTPPPSGISSKSVPKNPSQQQSGLSIEKMFETFHQASNGEFKPTFYNPFEVRHRRRTSRSQFKTLERAFMENCKPPGQVRKQLAQELNMSIRSIQVWFQNRRAKLKTLLKNGKMTDKQMMEYLESQKQQQHLNGQGSESENQDSPSSFEDSEASDSESAEVTKTDSMKPNTFNSQKRSFPPSNVVVHDPPAIVCNPNMMPYGNSYPNQVRTRSYSLPAIQRSPQLPFKQLQEALFGQTTDNEQQQAQQYNSSLSSLNAFQHYLRASNAVMSQVHSSNLQDVNGNANYYPNAQQLINIPQLNNFTPLHEYSQGHQVDPNRFRPRSSSFAVPLSNSRSLTNTNTYQNDILSMIKEDSPISEYMNIPNSYEQQQQAGGHHHHVYYDGNDSELLSNQIGSLDLDYFMASNGASYHGHIQEGHSGYPHSHSSSSNHSSSVPKSPIISANASGNNLNLHNYMNELEFLPQPTNEILLSTLIGDEHFLQ